jgi:hypothetical protein
MRRRRPARALALGLASACVAGCGQQAPGTPWFPLQAGQHWEYELRTERDNSASASTERLVLHNLGSGTPPGLPGGAAWQRRSDSGVDYWLRADASGIYRVGSRPHVQAEVQPDSAPRYVLKAPYSVGTQWQASTTSYLLERKADFPREVRHSLQPVTMHYRIEAVSEEVSTAAGVFKGCLRVHGEAQLRLFVDPVQGWRELPLSTREWYCPGVGLVRLERRELVNSAFMSGGTLTMELRAWK